MSIAEEIEERDKGVHIPSDQEPEVKVRAQERHGANVHKECSENADDHEGMPRRDFDGYHEEFVEDENGITYSHHLGSVDFCENLGQALDHAALVDGHKDPDEEGPV